MNIKGFNHDLTCNGFQYEIGKTYDTGAKDNELKLCSDTVFHYCKSLRNANNYYSVFDSNNRYCEIEVIGAEIGDGKKYGSNKIKILREIVGDELNELLGETNGNTGYFNTDSHNTGSHNTGSHNSGSYNSGSFDSGHFNSGSFDSGHFNSGGFNSGSYNSGWYNTGWYNSGSYNSGWYNTGWYNSGIFNKCDGNNGVFCTVEPTIKIFDIDTDITLNEFYRSKWYKAICSSNFCLTRVEGDELKTISYYDACKMWWVNMTDENKQIIQTIPNFNKGKFYEITGIKIQEG